MGEKGPLRPPAPCIAALVLALVPAVATGDGHGGLGACRDGVPNGAYELRATGDTPRVVGAFANGRLTGTFIFWTPGGARMALIPFDNDAKSGTVALWYAEADSALEAGRKLEAPYVDDRLHGIERSWYPGGVPRAEYRYEHGLLTAARAWTEAGTELSAAAARDLAVADADADERFYASLVAIVRANLPSCD